MSGRHALHAAAIVTAALAGCGGADEPPLTDTQRMVRTAQELTRTAETLTEEVSVAADELAAQAPAEETEERLEDVRDRARDLAERASDELPEELPVRDELEGAGARLAAAADELLGFAESGEVEQLANAQAAIGDARRLQASAAHQLADRPPRELEALIERLRAVPAP